ncbi:hypothetical protein JW859_08910 [bacterium]|nr:hypothetical protein [bacterium]
MSFHHCKYSLDDLAKVLGRSPRSLRLDVRTARLSCHATVPSYVFTLRELERYLGARRARELFGRRYHEPDVIEPITRRMKQCNTCHRLLPEAEFERDLLCRDGLRPSCRSCANQGRRRLSRRN